MSKIILRDYQQKAINETLNKLKNQDEIVNCLIVGGGKTVLIAELASILSKERNVVVLTNISALIPQLANMIKIITGEEPNVIKSGEYNTNTNSNIYLTMEQSFHEKTREQYKHLIGSYVLKDECFTPDMEVLTNKGFIRFDKLEKINNIKIANYNIEDKTIYYDKNFDFIKKYINEEIYDIESKYCSISCTLNHDFILEKNNLVFKEKAKNLKYNYYIPRTAKGCGKSNTLTDEEKLGIMFQADGSYHYVYKTNPKKCSIIFTFKKQRKINELKKLNFNFNKVKSRVGFERFTLSNVDKKNVSKKLRDMFNIEDFSKEKAIKFLDYLVKFDGYINPNGSYYYSSKIKDNVDFVQEVSLLAGYSTIVRKHEDNRKDSYSTIYRITISKNIKYIKTDSLIKNRKKRIYKGFVYCVSVKTGSIIVRRNGKYTIIGNCHKGFKGKTYKDIKRFLKPKKIIGFTATPHNAKGELFWDNEQLIEPITAKELEEIGYWSKIDYIIPKASKLIDVDNMESTAIDFTDVSNATEFIKNLEPIVASFREKIKGKKTLIFCSTIEQAEKYASKLKEIGFRVGVVHSNKSQQENKDITRRFKDELKVLDKDLFNQELEVEEPIDVLVSVTSLSIGFDAPNAEVLVNLRATKSLLLYVQMIVGRICRPYEKYNNQKTIIDYGHTVKRFGLGRDYSIERLLNGYYNKKNQEKRERLYEKLMSYEEDDLIIPSIYTYEDSLNKAIEYMKKKYGYNIEIEFNSLWYKDGFVKLIRIGSEFYNKKADFLNNQDIKIATDGTVRWVLNKLAETDFGKRMKRLKTFFDNVENDTAVELYRNAYERLYRRFFKAFKTRIKNIALQSKKFAGIAFFGDFLLEDNDTKESFEAIENFIDENFIEIVVGNKIEYKKKEKNNIDDLNAVIDNENDEYYTLDECPF